MFNGREPLNQYAFFNRFLNFTVIGGSFFAGATIDNDCFFGPESFGSAGHVNCGIAAAVDDHAPSKERGLALFHPVQHIYRIQYSGGLTGWYIRPLADLCAHGQKYCIKSFVYCIGQIVDLVSQLKVNAHLGNAGNFSI